MKIHSSTLRLLALATFFLSCFRAGAEEARWLSDFNAAVAAAKASHRDILMDFTGSDWCPVCIRMEKDILSTPAFKDYASKNLILMRVDFPEGRQLPQKVQDQNNDLQNKYGAQYLPTYILLDGSGNVLWQEVGYVEGGPSAFIAKLDSLKK